MTRATPTHNSASHQRLYDISMPSTRTGPLYNAFPYPTKISPESIALFIAAHTSPGETIFDGFAGSGTTGLATLLCEKPTPQLRKRANELRLKVQWGPRNAVLYELGVLGSFIAQTLTHPPDPQAFSEASQELLTEVENAYGWMYCANDPYGSRGSIRYVIWADVVNCPACNAQSTIWDSSVDLSPARIGPDFTCPTCSYVTSLDEVKRITSIRRDDILDSRITVRERRPARVLGVSGKSKWSRLADDEDIALLQQIEREPIPDSVPRVLIPWGDLYRRGYHTGITHLHHFYTRRNLIMFGRLWERTERFGLELSNALKFWLLSYNASHATNMTRVVAKTGQNDLVVTSAQPGVLYISGLPVEKNILLGLRRKLSTIINAFSLIRGRKGNVEVNHGSSCSVQLPDNSVDYIFTDPPFGGNIPYAEVNFINEAWLGKRTDQVDEVTVSNNQQKTITDYESLLSKALSEGNRILKPGRKATVVFHSAESGVWNAFQNAYTSAGFSAECASILDKTQGSFKQVTTNGAVRGDPVLLLTKQSASIEQPHRNFWRIADQLLRSATKNLDPAERTVHRLYSRLVSHYLLNSQPVPVDADTFYRWFAKHHMSQVITNAND